MAETKLPDGTLVSVLVANINVKATLPTTSIGQGEMIYCQADSTPYINHGTASIPDWGPFGGGGFPNPATENLNMATFKVQFGDGTNPADSEVYRDSSGYLVLKGLNGIKMV